MFVNKLIYSNIKARNHKIDSAESNLAVTFGLERKQIER